MEELKAHTDELCTILTAENGRPYSMAQWEITWIFETYVPALLQMELPESTWNETGVGQITKRYVPLGVVAAISPWNLPFLLSFTKVLPSLLAGNTVVLKPAVFTPLTVLRATAETGAKFNPPAASWTLYGAVVRPKSRDQIRLTGPNPDDPIQIEANSLSHPDDMKAAVAHVELCREIGNSAALRPFTKREVMPGNLRGTALEDFIRDAASTYHHQTCTAKMGRDSMSVVDGRLKVHGIENLRIADGSIMPRVTTGNTMAPCIIIGERAAEALRNEHGLETSSL
jgi:choline dehydrogenase-like flavoprotein